MPYSQDLEKVQWAREAVKGTDLPATSVMIVERFNPQGEAPVFRPRYASGLVLANRGGEQVISRGTRWTAEGPLTFEQAQNLFSGAIENVASPTGLGPYVWTHTRNPANIPSLATFTFERREDDGATPIDHAFHYGLFESLELTFALNETWRYNATGVARRKQEEALTAALSLPTHEIVQTPGTEVYIDSTWATRGTTQILGQVLGGRVRFGSGAGARFTADGRADLDFAIDEYASSRVTMELELTMLLGGHYATERAAAEALSLRAVQLHVPGTGNNDLVISGLLKHEKAELYDFDFDDEQVVYSMRLVGSTDNTNAWEAVVTNDVSSFA